jgi:nicotinamidase-related amidase
MTRLALIVVDMQVGLLTPATARRDVPGLIARLNDLAGRLREGGNTIIYVQHEGPAGSEFHPSHPGHALHPDLEVQATDLIVRKTSCDAFLDTNLARAVEDSGAEALVVTGCATDFCVDTTVRSALARGYRTIVPTDGHTTADRPHLPAAKIIEHHNAIWADFLSPAGAAVLCRCEEVTPHYP